MNHPWSQSAACRTSGVNMFPPTDRDQAAKNVCSECPCRAECLDYAIKNEELYGVWGGTGELERRALIMQYKYPPCT